MSAPATGTRNDGAGRWTLRLYVAGQTPRAIQALATAQKLCQEELPGRYHIEVVDLLKDPGLARGDQIVAVPTLVRTQPPPVRRIVGKLSNLERVRAILNLHHRR